MNSLMRFSSIVPLLFILASGCGKGSGDKPAGHALASPLVVKCPPGQSGGRLTLAVTGTIGTFNPLAAADAASENASRLIFGSLTYLDLTTQEVVAGMAESWSVEPDQKTWTFKLREGLRWSDGKPLTADDVVFTWNAIMYDPEFNRGTYAVFMAGGRPFTVSKLDDVTVRVITADVFAPFLEYFGGVYIFPKHVFEESVKSRRFFAVYNPKTPPRNIVGNGPYRVKEIQGSGRVLFERNPEYWAADSTGQRLPYLDEVMFVPCEPGQSQRLFLDGKCDVYEHGRPEEFAVFSKPDSGTTFQVQDLGPGMDANYLFFNQNTGVNIMNQPLVPPGKLRWFRDRKFRQAVSCAIDRDRLVKEGYGGRARPMLTFISENNRKWHNPEVPRFAYDPARARTLLSEMGLEDRNGDGVLEDAAGAPVEFKLHTNLGNPLREREAMLVAQDLGKVGIKAVVHTVRFDELQEMSIRRFDFECMLLGLGGGAADPASQVNVLRSDEPLHQWFPNQRTPSTQWEARIDQLMDAQIRTLDYKERKKLFDETQAILAEELPMIGTVSPYQFIALNASLANARPSSVSPYRATWNLQELYFKR